MIGLRVILSFPCVKLSSFLMFPTLKTTGDGGDIHGTADVDSREEWEWEEERAAARWCQQKIGMEAEGVTGRERTR